MRSYFHLLRDNPDYSRLWLAQVISLLGDWFNTIALSALVIAYSPEYKGLAISGLMLARVVPPMLISPIAGVLVDRLDRKRLLVWSNYLRALVVLLFLLATRGAEWLWLVYALTVIQFVLSSVFEPGQSAIIPNLVREHDLVPANTLVSVTWSVMLAVGAVIGGVVSSVLGTDAALIIDALSFAVAGWLIAPIKADKFQIEVHQPQSPQPEHDTSFSEGLRFLRRNPSVLATVLIKAAGSLGAVDTLMAIFATQIFVYGSGGQLSLGVMYSAFGLGAILGPVLANRFNDSSVASMRRLIVVGFAFIVFGWVTLTGASTLLLACLAFGVRAMGASVNWTYSTIIVQKLVPNIYRGRMFSMDMAIYYLAIVVSTVTHGTLVDTLGTAQIYWIAFGTMIVSLLPLVLWTLATRRFERVRIVSAAAD